MLNVDVVLILDKLDALSTLLAVASLLDSFNKMLKTNIVRR
jgi:hypothetical protein